MKKKIRLFIFFGLCNCILIAQTQKNIQHQNLLWTRYYNQLEIDKKWSIHSEFDNRVFTNSIVQNLFVIRVQVRYKVNEKIDLGSGFAYFSVATQDPNVESGFNKPEYRIQHDLVLKQNFGKINLNHRYQIEERFFQKFDTQGLISGTTFAMRFRYRIQGDYIFWKKENQSLKAILSDEIMINTGNGIVKNTFDQNRIYAAFQYGINENFSVELGYLNSFQQRASGVDYFDRNILRLSVYHKLKL